VNSYRLGLAIGAAFGTVYVVVNAAALAAPFGLLLQILGVAAFAGLLVVLFRTRPAPASVPSSGQVGFGRGYWIVVAAEVLAFFAGTLALRGPLALPLAVLPWITFVVGVHFLGLAKVWRARSVAWMGAALTACGVLGLVLAALRSSQAAVSAVAGVAPGLVLLGFGWWAGTRTAPHRTVG
jgi:hypothetical protein